DSDSTPPEVSAVFTCSSRSPASSAVSMVSSRLALTTPILTSIRRTSCVRWCVRALVCRGWSGAFVGGRLVGAGVAADATPGESGDQSGRRVLLDRVTALQTVLQPEPGADLAHADQGDGE